MAAALAMSEWDGCMVEQGRSVATGGVARGPEQVMPKAPEP